MRRKIVLFMSLILFGVVLSGCGSAPVVNPHATPTPSVVLAGTADGCPSTAVVTVPPALANVTVHLSDFNTTLFAHVGDSVEIRLPFGHRWSGPTTSQGVLELQPPAGFSWKADRVCIWRFVARQAGTVNLLFYSRALCQAGEFCPMYIVEIPFTIEVKSRAGS